MKASTGGGFEYTWLAGYARTGNIDDLEACGSAMVDADVGAGIGAGIAFGTSFSDVFLVELTIGPFVVGAEAAGSSLCYTGKVGETPGAPSQMSQSNTAPNAVPAT